MNLPHSIESKQSFTQSTSANDVLKKVRKIFPAERGSYVNKLYFMGVLADIIKSMNASRREQFYRLTSKSVCQKANECMKTAMRECERQGR